ncbi:hypothetical protein JIN84_05870 [Luteolibacter yonseiensis]|uniref:Uncharacterized protein n=1 Tax=Luteolibacter yonseiensis TaxID=1144680 RepID=A0A934R1L9_9BACT|nr:glycosyltransferase [Luteolibacter yonseiensis]MBK1815129.1 hypothetical protein [Luteolibacter yonseiensis]
MSFPRIIHQSWKSSGLPGFLARRISTVREKHPDWEHRFHTEADMEEVVAECGVMPVEDFRRIPTEAGKEDVFRCAVLFRDGGVYCDPALEAVKPLEEMFGMAVWDGFVSGGEELLMTVDHPVHCEVVHGQDVVMNDFMVAMPRARFLGIYLGEVAAAAREGRLGGDPAESTGPLAISRMIDEHGGPSACGIALLPSSWVSPLPDMSLDFPEKDEYEGMIASGSWRRKMDLYLVKGWGES